MSKALILFSGGVESTAMLTIARDNDILLNIDHVYPGAILSPNSIKAEKIAQAFNKQVQYSTLSIPAGGGEFVHQMRYFIFVASLWVARDSSVTEIWCGRNSAEPSGNIKPFIEDMMLLWTTMHPTVAFDHPLDHLSKTEQWNLIPKHIQPLVSWCITDSDCGKCHKCVEFKDMVTIV